VSGYTPVFGTIFSGTLFGQYPDTAAWLFLLALADKNGHVDMTPQYIAGVTGMPLDDLRACLQRFTEPDPASRSQEHEGRRLMLLDTARPWGWQIVNFHKYREKARLAAKNARDVEAGKEAERKRTERERDSAGVRRESSTDDDVRRSPPPSTSQTHTHTKTQTREEQEGASLVVGLNLEAWKQWDQYRSSIKKPIKKPSRQAAMQALANFGEEQMAVVRNSMANGYQGLFAPKDNGMSRAVPHKSSDELEAECIARGEDPWELKP
jgi:hypothetical protein